MIGVLIAFALSWLIVWLFFKEHITALGIVPTGRRMKLFLIGMVVMALFCSINSIGQTYFREFAYVRNPEYGFWQALNGVWWTVKAALLEELIFRGAILYLLIRKLGIVPACIISAAAFGVYHWFSYGMIGGRIVPMIYVFLLTGAAGWAFAYSFAKTKSILVPLGLHCGWIVMSIVVFSNGPLGDSLFIHDQEKVEMGGWPQLMFFSFQTLLVPGLITWYFVKKFPRIKEA
jgi:membrane protease YdiL (CAAX protease family)